MIIVVEGPSAAGKTSWIATHCPPATVISEAPGAPAPDRTRDPDDAAALRSADDLRAVEVSAGDVILTA